ncbi:winged helix-turn-helix domain-containing protein [Parabacteroides distasonis]|uniref:winged helix-turn-helix domain-containing protein n=1 Tax=Parabacteroides distasonis TaxID=823 RepID=UPI00189E2BE2|nr:winged helix-turn-helix domain-containing protein [Parabacteroides distasonis]MDB9152935.1 winged helix-turn-helix domain-containing protein [Parabacteroides distasonis]MDB9157512.1 winged helix-turn-helix domain-containing protein [Parabacteroides distasonis]MDB9163951.1 winged helix-turn-helix domain-containing protein [Parabacteroides distasonis]MDB9167807.1 winged helix-turn-helix domain-containing protein [Parabacteroides distasonis]MDB9196649.1 winged helix-turn-helix domain-containin
MNKDTIGTNAGIIWRIMDNHMSWNYAELKEKSGLSDMDLCAAIGWLARENKIEFDNESKDLRIYLNFNPYF